MASPLSVNLDDIDEFSPAVAGNKAFYQALLRRHGINCPSGICITTAYFLELLNQNGPAALSNDRTAPFRARRALRNAVIGKNIEDDVRNFFNRINAAPGQRALCVRSSSPLEDAKSASFAGQFFSSCGLTNVEDAVSAIKSCYLSLYSDTALLYCQRHAISVVDLTIAVLVTRDDKLRQICCDVHSPPPYAGQRIFCRGNVRLWEPACGRKDIS